MLGRFLEFSIATPDIQTSLAFYTKLGFSEVPVGEAWAHPYAVVTDGRICLGLHAEPSAAPSLTFVRPDLLKHLNDLEGQGLEFEFRRLGNDVFNEIGWRDCSGQLIRLIEARTFSPGKRAATDTGLCGYFLKLALPAPDLEAAKESWERFGFVGWDETGDILPHIACTSDAINLGLYDPAHVRAPTLTFDAGDVVGTLARLAEVGILPEGPLPPPLRQLPAASLTAPEGTRLLLLSEAIASGGGRALI